MPFNGNFRIITIAAAVVIGVAVYSASRKPDRAPVATVATAAPEAATAAPPFQVRVEGTGSPMILIPGLMCDGTVWNATVERFKTRYQCHVLSLAGFAGVPPVEGPFIPTMRDAILQYIRTNRLEKPVIVGHSLGGHLGLAISIAAPQETGAIVVVDGAAALGALMSPGASPEAVSRQSEALCNGMAAMPQEAFAAQNRFMLAQMVQNPKTVEQLAQRTGRSDVKTVARAMHEVMTADLRDAADRIQSPVLLIGAADYAKDATVQAAVRGRYEQQVAKIPNHKVEMVYDARHFVMLDKPEFFYGLVEKFLAAAR